jgi:hypothetical protein
MSLPSPKRISDTEFVSTGWEYPKCISQQIMRHSGIQKMVLPMTYRNYLYQTLIDIIQEHSHWFRPVIPEELYSKIIHTPSFIQVDVQTPGIYTIQNDWNSSFRFFHSTNF